MYLHNIQCFNEVGYTHSLHGHLTIRPKWLTHIIN